MPKRVRRTLRSTEPTWTVVHEGLKRIGPIMSNSNHGAQWVRTEKMVYSGGAGAVRTIFFCVFDI